MSVRVAVSEAPELAAAAGIKMLPALRLYRTDEKPVAYRGPLEPAGALASRLRRETNSATPLVANSAKEVRDEVDAVEQTAVLFAQPTSKAARAFADVFRDARSLRLQVSFVVAEPKLAIHFDPSAPDDAPPPPADAPPLLLLFRSFDEELIVYDGPSLADEAAGTSAVHAVRVRSNV